MSQVIKIKRGGISGISGASTVKGELIIATGSLGNNASGPFLLAHGDSLGLVAGAIFTGSSVPTITDSELNGILFYDSANSRFMRLDSSGNQALNIAATGFTGDTDDVAEGSTNLYYTNARVKTKLTAEAVISGSATNVRTFLNVEDGADVTDATNVTAAGALMDSELTEIATVKALTAAGISGSFNVASASFSTRVTANDAKLTANTTNVTAAGALMDSEVTNLAQVKAFDSSDYATSAQGTKADNAATLIQLNASSSALQSNIDGKQATLTFGKLSGNALKSEEALTTNDVLLMGASNVKGRTYSEFRGDINVEDGADVTDTTNVTAAGALMDSELSNLAAVKAINQSLVSGATPTFTTTNFTDATNKRLLTDAQEAKIDALDQALATTSNVTFASASLANLTVTGNASIQGTLTTVNSNDVNIGDRIITLNTADGAGDAGIHVHDTNGAQTASIVWDTDGDYWKVGVVGSTQYRLAEWDGEVAGGGDFLVTNADGRIDALATSTAGDILQSDGDGTFTITNTIDGGSY
tara:strand:+ start:3222 stop:4814 length:1593 start_codon:yes stop_codon:yes gene_type:complete